MAASTEAPPGASPDEILPLRGVTCRRCGHTAAPVQRFGCERCGAFGADLAELTLSGQGTVLAAVVVHRHPDPGIAVPAVVCRVLLAEGPVVRAPFDGGTEPPGPGTAVTAAVAPSADAPYLVFRAAAEVRE